MGLTDALLFFVGLVALCVVGGIAVQALTAIFDRITDAPVTPSKGKAEWKS